MIRLIFRYGFLFFLLNTVLLSIESTYSLGHNIFIGIMTFYAFILLINPIQIKVVLFHRSFLFLLYITIINLFFWLLFHDLSDLDALKYLLARSIQFSIICFSVYYNLEYYKSKFLFHLPLVIFFLVLVGLVSDPFIFSGRYSGIIWNPNMFSSFTCIAFAFIFLKDDSEDRTNLDLLLLFVFFLVSLASGSRGVIVGISLCFLIRYGFSMRNTSYAVIAMLLYFFVVNLQLETSFNRFYSYSLFSDRMLQYEYAYKTILNKPWFGYGLDKYAFLDLSLVPSYQRGLVIGAHNGYLAILAQYGVLFGGLVLSIILYKSIHLYRSFRSVKNSDRIYLFIIVFTLISSLYESLITGINEFNTILFWFSLAILSYSKYSTEHEN